MEINIPDNLRFVGNSRFLIRDVDIGNDKIYLFTTVANIRLLSVAGYWLMDGTFKVVPRILMQLYTIHAPVGNGLSQRVLPLVYALMSNKSQESYSRFFQELKDFAGENGFELNVPFIISDFELAVINSCRIEFPNTEHKCCHFHFSQCIWRRIQSNGLSLRYGQDENFSMLIRNLSALAFLPSQDIPDAFIQIKEIMPIETEGLITWFEETFVLGRTRRVFQNGTMLRNLALFPPSLWSVHDQTIMGLPRTQNEVEGWHRRFQTLVGRNHVGLYHLIEELHKEQQEIDRRVEGIVRGDTQPSRRREYIMRDQRLNNIIADRENRSVLEFLRGIAHNMTF